MKNLYNRSSCFFFMIIFFLLEKLLRFGSTAVVAQKIEAQALVKVCRFGDKRRILEGEI